MASSKAIGGGSIAAVPKHDDDDLKSASRKVVHSVESDSSDNNIVRSSPDDDDLRVSLSCFHRDAEDHSKTTLERKPNCSNPENLKRKADGLSAAECKRSKEGVNQEETSMTSNNKATTVSKPLSSGNEEQVNSVGGSEPWVVLPQSKLQKGLIPYNPRIMRRQPPLTQHVKMMSWNVNGLKDLLKSQGNSLVQLAQREDFDVLCLQETKLHEKVVEAIKYSLLEGYEHSYWTCNVSNDLAYSGTAIISRIKPLSVRYGLGMSEHDSEGRLVTLEFDKFYLIGGYVPNSGRRLQRVLYRVTKWDPCLSNYVKELEKAKPVVLTGDLNCAHEDIDIHNPAGNKRKAGFTFEERQSFKINFLNKGFVDTFRHQHPAAVGYSYWGSNDERETNKGWRLDYFLVSESMVDKVYDSYILPDVSASDHSPIGLILTL